METRFESNLIVSGMTMETMKALYKFLDDNNYSYVGSESIYKVYRDDPFVSPCPSDNSVTEINDVKTNEEESSMTFEEYIKQMSHKELQNFIYWVYQNGWEDHSNGAEDSPGDWSFFGGAILKYPAGEVIEKLDDYYGEEWRDA